MKNRGALHATDKSRARKIQIEQRFIQRMSSRTPKTRSWKQPLSFIVVRIFSSSKRAHFCLHGKGLKEIILQFEVNHTEPFHCKAFRLINPTK